MSGATYAHLYDQFTDTAFRLECRQTYAVQAEDPSTRAFRENLPRPERSVRTSPWLARIAVDTAPIEQGGRGKDWSRVRLIEWPLTDYTRHELLSYVESQAAGERIQIAAAAAVNWNGPDFWLFDAGHVHACAVELHYTDDGAVTERRFVDDRRRLRRLTEVRDAAVHAAVDLNQFLVAPDLPVAAGG